MVAQHYRWDFYGLSTDSKPDATNPKVANGSTYYEADTSKLYVWYNDQWYEKQAGGELPVASADTLGGVKVGEGLSIDEGGVLSASGGGGGEAGAFKELTSADYNYPADNPTKVALWLLPPGTYYVDNSASLATNISIWKNDNAGYYDACLFQIYYPPQNTSNVIIVAFGNPSSSDVSGTYGLRQYFINRATGNKSLAYIYNATSA